MGRLCPWGWSDLSNLGLHSGRCNSRTTAHSPGSWSSSFSNRTQGFLKWTQKFSKPGDLSSRKSIFVSEFPFFLLKMVFLAAILPSSLWPGSQRGRESPLGQENKKFLACTSSLGHHLLPWPQDLWLPGELSMDQSSSRRWGKNLLLVLQGASDTRDCLWQFLHELNVYYG